MILTLKVLYKFKFFKVEKSNAIALGTINNEYSKKFIVFCPVFYFIIKQFKKCLL